MPPKKQHHNYGGNEISAKVSLSGINWSRWRPIMAALGIAGMGGGGVKVASHFHDDTAGRIEGARIEQTKDLKASISDSVKPLDRRISSLEASVVEMGKQLAALTQQVKDQGEIRRVGYFGAPPAVVAVSRPQG